MSLFFLLLLIISISLTSPLNILIWNPTVGHSHVRFLGNIADVLYRDGHNVTVLSPITDPLTQQYGTKEDVHKLSYTSKYSDPAKFAELEAKSASLWYKKHPNGMAMSWSDIAGFTVMQQSVCRGMSEDREFVERVKTVHFDLGIFEVFDFCGMAMTEMFGIKKSIVAGSLGTIPFHDHLMGLPTFTSFVPGFLTVHGDDMSFWERVDNYEYNEEMEKFNARARESLQNIMKANDPNFPDLLELFTRQASLILLNANEFTETPRPRTNMIQNIGGAGLYPAHKLPQEFENILGLRNSTVIFSLGTFVDSCEIPKNVKLAFLEAFSAFENVTFIWKYDDCPSDTIDFSRYSNVKIVSWMPQIDLLADDRVVLFITHAGMNSVIEAVHNGKPLITIPLFADQMINSRNAVNRGYAIEIQRADINKEILVEAMEKILEPGSPYRRAASVAASVLEGEPEAARERIRRWARLVGTHGPLTHLPLRARDMSTIQLYNLDVMAYLVITKGFWPVIIAIVALRMLKNLFTFKAKSQTH